MKTNNRLFFSGEVADGGFLADFCNKESWLLDAQSLLTFEPVPFEIHQPFDVVFISSPRSFNYFKRQLTDSGKIVYAVIGQSTANKINLDNSSIDFIGEKSGDPAAVAVDFKNWLGDRRVLFPLSTRSNETVATVIPDTQKELVRCYETKLIKKKIEPAGIYVFTSPSNVEAFLLKNKLPESAIVVAWGTSTRKKLVQNGREPEITLDESSEKSLVEALRNFNSLLHE